MDLIQIQDGLPSNQVSSPIMRGRLRNQGGFACYPKVLHVLSSLDKRYGGPPRSVMSLALAQAQLGAPVWVIAGGTEDLHQHCDNGGVQVSQGSHMLPRFGVPGPRLIRQLKRQIQEAEIVHIHGTWTGMTSLAGRLCRHNSTPYVISPRGMLDRENTQGRRPWLKKLYCALVERDNFDGARGWHFLDKSEQDGCSWMDLARQRTDALIAPNGLDADGIAGQAERPEPLSESWPESKLNLVFLGRLNEIKGLELQVEVLSVLKHRGIPAVLHLIGPDDGEASRLVEYAASLGVEEDLRLVGPIYDDERFRWLRKADAVLLTSHNECNSFSAAETFASGGLLIATDTCHLHVAQSEGAAVVVHRSAADVADAVERVAYSRARAAKVRANAHRYSRKYLARDQLAARMLDFYLRVLRRQPAESVRPVARISGEES